MNAPIPPVRRNDRYLEITKDRENFSSLEQATQDRLREAAAGNLRVKLADKTPTAKLDQDTATYIDTANKKLSLYLYHLANEPSLGLYHTAAHVQRSVPNLVTLKNGLKSKSKALVEVGYTLDETIMTIQSMQSIDSFKRISTLLTSSSQMLSELLRLRNAPTHSIPASLPRQSLSPSHSQKYEDIPRSMPAQETKRSSIETDHTTAASITPDADSSQTTYTEVVKDTNTEPIVVDTNQSSDHEQPSASSDQATQDSDQLTTPSLLDELELAKSHKKKKKPARDFKPKNF